MSTKHSLGLFALLSMLTDEFSVERDNDVKKVGDRVKPITPVILAYFIDVETGEQLSTGNNPIIQSIQDIFMNTEMIVTEIEQKKEFMCGHCDMPHRHDLIVYLPQLKKRYYTSSHEVKIV